MIRIRLFGASGRMGRAIATALEDRGDVVLADGEAAVFIDFSAPGALSANLDAAIAAGKPIVVGTTGLSPDHHRLMDEAAGAIPLLYAANMSLGVNLLAHLVHEAAARLGQDWDIEILEMHHRHKKDAPSGTALMLGDAAARARGATLGELAEEGRAGLDSVRAEGSVGFSSLRGGSVAGDHLVVFAGEGERLELGHRAESRAIFANGAITAALWLKDQPPGRYSMADVLGLES